MCHIADLAAEARANLQDVGHLRFLREVSGVHALPWRKLQLTWPAKIKLTVHLKATGSSHIWLSHAKFRGIPKEEREGRIQQYDILSSNSVERCHSSCQPDHL